MHVIVMVMEIPHKIGRHRDHCGAVNFQAVEMRPDAFETENTVVIRSEE